MSKKQPVNTVTDEATEVTEITLAQVATPVTDPQIAAWQTEYNELAKDHQISEGLVKGQLGSQMRRLHQKIAQRELELYGTPFPAHLIDKGKPGYQAKTPQAEYTEALNEVLSGLEKLTASARKLGKKIVWNKALNLQAEIAQLLDDDSNA